MVLVARSKKNRKRRARAIITSVITFVFIAGIFASLTALGYYVAGLNTVFPNVWAEGIDMTGLTRTEAAQVLIDNGYEETASGISVTVNFPYGSSFTITGNDVGFSLSAAEAAKLAYQFGRDGGFYQNTFSYIGAFIGKTELGELSTPEYDTTAIRERAAEHTRLFNEELFDNNMEVDDERITIVKGMGYAPADEMDVYNLAEHTMRRAIEQYAHLSVDFFPEASTDDTVGELQSVFEYIHSEPVSSYYDQNLGDPKSDNYDPVNKGATESSVGKTFDLQAAEEIYNSAENGETVVIPIILLEPELSQAQLRDMLYGDVLCERFTSSPSSQNRKINVELAAKAIDGLILQPGEVFSFNGVVGQRTEAKGYKPAGVFIDGELDEDIGGGICQVSSTIYAALLQTDIEIVSRAPHGRMVTYLYGGQDATVSYGAIDFKFRNSTEYPIQLEVTASDSVSVDVKIHGTRISDIYYEVVTERHEDDPIKMTTDEREVKPEDGIELAPGEKRTVKEGRDGRIFEVWKYHYSSPDFEDPDSRILDENGEHVRTLANKSTYRMQQELVLFNPEEPERTDRDDDDDDDDEPQG